MAFEALNHAGAADANLLVVLNDNAIGIDPSVGALKSYLTQVKQGKNPRVNNMIKSLNFQYTGPIDGHHLSGLIRELQHLKKQKGARFLHVITRSEERRVGKDGRYTSWRYSAKKKNNKRVRLY